METFEVHYWNEDGEAKVAIVEGEDDGGAEAAASIEDLARLGHIKAVPNDPEPVEDIPTDEDKPEDDEGDE